jgi:lysyl-tRNA synthetase class 2
MTEQSAKAGSHRSLWWMPHSHFDRRPLLLARGRIKAAIRAWFESQDFVEVDTACLQVSPGNETHLNAFATELIGPDLSRATRYLHTSPELAMKKLLAAGERRIFTFTPVFRNRERGRLHAPEFTMLEWYRTGEPYERLWEDCAEIVRIADETAGQREWQFNGASCDPLASARRISVDDAFAQHAGMSLAATQGRDGPDRDAFRRLASASGIATADDDTWSDIFSRVLVERVEPALGRDRPDILHTYPVEEAAMARRIESKPRLAERFELFVCGVELANGFGELIDAAEQRRRLEAQMQERERIYGERYPIDEDFIAALAHMGPASGCALGFDRLVMLATAAEHIDQVQWTPVE